MSTSVLEKTQVVGILRSTKKILEKNPGMKFRDAVSAALKSMRLKPADVGGKLEVDVTLALGRVNDATDMPTINGWLASTVPSTLDMAIDRAVRILESR